MIIISTSIGTVGAVATAQDWFKPPPELPLVIPVVVFWVVVSILATKGLVSS